MRILKEGDMTKIIENMTVEEWIETLIEELKVEYIMMNAFRMEVFSGLLLSRWATGGIFSW